MANINIPYQIHTCIDGQKRLLQIAQMEACHVPRVKRVGNLRAAFQANIPQTALPASVSSSTVELDRNFEHAVKRLSSGLAYTRPIVRQDSSIVSEHHCSTKVPRSRLSQRVQADRLFHISGEKEDNAPISLGDQVATVHGVSFRFPDPGLDLSLHSPHTENLVQRASYISIQFHNGIAYQHEYTSSIHAPPLFVQNTTPSRRWSQPGDWLYNGDKGSKYHFKYWNDSPDYAEWTWEAGQIDRSPTPPEHRLQHMVSQTVEKTRMAAVRLHVRDLPRIPDWYKCCSSSCNLGCAPKMPKKQV
jgi:hypothetical protein